DVVPLGATQRGEEGWSAPLEYLSYTFNEAVLGRRDWSLATPQGNSTRVRRPSSVCLFCDGLPRNQSELWFTIYEAGSDWTLGTYYDNTKGFYTTFDFKRHRGRMNVVFCDDHAETVNIPSGLKNIGLSLGIYR